LHVGVSKGKLVSLKKEAMHVGNSKGKLVALKVECLRSIALGGSEAPPWIVMALMGVVAAQPRG
jgi:hypothetical protein